MATKKKLTLLIAALVIVFFTSVIIIKYIHKNDCNFLTNQQALSKAKKTDNNFINYKIVEKDTQGTPSEGTNIKFYYDKKTGDRVLVEVSSFAAIVRYFTKYYTDNDKVYFIDSTTDEWDLKKLYGENGELSSTEGEHVVGVSTKEQYIISNNTLCKYLADKPRVASVAVTKSNPELDVKELIDMYQSIVDNTK